MTDLETQVLIIGGGATGTGLARDLALRGVQCILAEKMDINAGASGGNHGLLHSGARYVSNDTVSAMECREEGELLKRLAPQCIEETGGLFVAVEGDDENFIADFPLMCAKCSIPVQELTPEEALDMEPVLSGNLIAAFALEDASVDPFRLSLENVAHARSLGTRLLRYAPVVGFDLKQDRIQSVRLFDKQLGKEIAVSADLVVNATGAWAGDIAALAGIPVHVLYSKGTLLITSQRITERVINRLRPPSDADILVPGGTVSILGTTSLRIPSLETIGPTVEEVDRIIEEGAAMVPILEEARYIRAYAGVRPLVQIESQGDDRSVSRGFTIFDHSHDGLDNLVTITGGKLTTYRLMAERTADMICHKLGVSAPCLTGTVPLPGTQVSGWSYPGLSPKEYMKSNNPEDVLLCECEMVPKSVVDSIAASIREQGGSPSFEAVALRSRLGKGSCQGTFCSIRTDAHMIDKGDINPGQGLNHLRKFLNERWKGQRPILWDGQLVRAEFLEALHCGLFDLER